MSGFKKAIYISLAVIILLGVLWVVIPRLKLNSKYTDPLTALPENALIFYKGDHFRSDFNEIVKSAFWENLNTLQSISSFVKTYASVDTALSKNPKISSYLNSQEIVLSLHKISRTKTAVLLLIQSRGKFNTNDIRKMLNTEMGIDASEHSFEGNIIYDYKLSDPESALSFTMLDDLLAISSSPLIIEDAVRSYNSSKGIINTKHFGSSFNEFKENWFINFNQLPNLLGLFVNDEYKDIANSLSFFAQSANYELNYDEESFSLRGGLQKADTFNGFCGLFQNQNPQKTEISKIASQKTAILCSYQISDFNAYLQQYQNYLKYCKSWSPYEAAKLNFEKEHHINIEKEILPLLKGSFALSFNEPFSKELNNSKTIYLSVEHAAEASAVFKSSAPKPYDSSGLFEDFYKSHEIYTTDKANLFYLILGSSFKVEKRAYFTSIRNYLVFCPTISSLKQVIDDFTSGQTLSSSSDYHRFSNKLVSESNFFTYINPIRANGILEYVLNNKWLEKNNRNSVITKMEVIGYQIVNNNNGFYNELICTFSASKTQSIEKIWEVKLDTSFSVKPHVFKNHNSGKLEVMIFDDQNNLYLISNSGEILWKRKIEGKLVGDIYQVDFYKNKKLQYLFATETHLQLIDRLGRNTANYPIRLSAKASSGIGIYQESKTDTRFFVGTDNNYIFGFSLSGKPMNGWSPQEINGNLKYPVRYFMRSNKTQFFGMTDKGSIYRWDLKGNVLGKKVELKTQFVSPLQMRFGVDHDDTYLISIDSAGNTYFVNLNDEVEMQHFGNFSKDVFFDYVDLNADKEKDLIFVDHSSFLSFSKAGEILFSLTLDAPASFQPCFLKLDTGYYMAYVNKEMNKLFMIDLNGIPERNFPVECNTPFEFYDMNGDGKPELLAGKDNKLYLSRF